MKEESPIDPTDSAGPPGASARAGSPRARSPLKPAYLILGDDLPKVELALNA